MAAEWRNFDKWKDFREKQKKTSIGTQEEEEGRKTPTNIEHHALPRVIDLPPEDIQKEKKVYNETYRQAEKSMDTTLDSSSHISPLEAKLNEVLSPLVLLGNKSELETKETQRIQAIRESWKTKGMTDPSEFPRLRVPENYDEDPRIQKAAKLVEKEIKEFKDSKLKDMGGEFGTVVDEQEELEMRDAEEIIQEYGSEDNRFEASELIEYKDYDWCISLRIDREKTGDPAIFNLLIYSYKCGIQRLPLSQQQIDSLGTSLLMKYKRNPDDSIEVLPIYSALPSTGLLSLKYRTNKGIELRTYGIVNFIDFLKDPDHSSHRTMIWTDALGPIYLTSADRSNIRRKLQMTESKIFAPLRMIQMTVKGDFNSAIIASGTMVKWSIASFTPLVEESQKDPNIGRNLWPARIIRFDDLLFDREILPRERHHRENSDFFVNNPNGGTLLRSHSEPDIQVFCGPNLTGILNSAGPTYATKGIHSAFVVPFFIDGKFVFYEALIAGPPRVVMLITEGRYLNYCPKTWPPTIQAQQNAYRKTTVEKPWVRAVPREMSFPEDRQKSMKGFEEFHFDFKI
ncbi:hypothetical protein GCK72_003818 [Caenorhabditis remanei]|uniref:Uncharacterized protein n=1 Tax=Caenorhabditis remanei TaxID=31234 RepID=A0A6A5HBU7_CAERE|nr:hypothetical protein GCK72_003818 [Caenorhabditis remanei]KAF1763872.1 hypothetical protein GCK72_003818 [Caenorhabditis remanei]